MLTRIAGGHRRDRIRRAARALCRVIEHQPRTLLADRGGAGAFSNGENIALKGKATQSERLTAAQWPSGRIDGRTEAIYANGSVRTPSATRIRAWWEVDLGAEVPVEKIVFWNRTEMPERIKGAKLLAAEHARQRAAGVCEQTFDEVPTPSAEFDPRAGVKAGLRNASADFAQDGFDGGDGDRRGQKDRLGLCARSGRRRTPRSLN